MKNLVRLLAVIALIIGSFWGKVPAQALNLTSIALPSLPVAVLNAADAKLTTEFGAKIDLNNSDIRDFRDLRGFYPNLAGKIIKNAPYQEVEDVLISPDSRPLKKSVYRLIWRNLPLLSLLKNLSRVMTVLTPEFTKSS